MIHLAATEAHGWPLGEDKEERKLSVAYYVVLDNEAPGFDTFVNGKFLAENTEILDSICKGLGIRRLDDFLTIYEDDISDMIGEEVGLPVGEGEQWFTAEEGISFVNTLITHIRDNPENIPNAAHILEDLAEYADLFDKAKHIGAKWHLNLDI